MGHSLDFKQFNRRRFCRKYLLIIGTRKEILKILKDQETTNRSKKKSSAQMIE